jgi:hypothetical protein
MFLGFTKFFLLNSKLNQIWAQNMTLFTVKP